MNNYLLIVLFLTFGIINSEAQIQNPTDFIPEGHIVFEKYYGDLNKDGQEDCILIIKKTNNDNIIINRFDEKVDRNRRGIIVLFKNENSYQLSDKNYNCFSSENEDGGVYFPPELSIEIERGNLIVQYDHGRYGFWRYIFRFQDSNFKLIGYDSRSNYGPIVNREISINFLTKKKLVKENTNENAEGGDIIFKETWGQIDFDKFLKLSQIKDFDELVMHNY